MKKRCSSPTYSLNPLTSLQLLLFLGSIKLVARIFFISSFKPQSSVYIVDKSWGAVLFFIFQNKFNIKDLNKLLVKIEINMSKVILPHTKTCINSALVFSVGFVITIMIMGSVSEQRAEI